MDSHRPRQINQSDCEISSNCGKKMFSILYTKLFQDYTGPIKGFQYVGYLGENVMIYGIFGGKTNEIRDIKTR